MNFSSHINNLFHDLENMEPNLSFKLLYPKDPKLTNRLNLDTQNLIKHMYFDTYYDQRLQLALESSHNADITVSILRKEDSYRLDFDEAFHCLTNNWNKFQETEYAPDFMWELFLVIYEAYPQICSDIFPVTLFILVDSYYEFCNLCYKHTSYIDTKSRQLPDTINDNQKESIQSLFYKYISGEYYIYYICSLIDTKGNYYSESSIHEGKRIYNKIITPAEKETLSTDPEFKKLDEIQKEICAKTKKEYQYRLDYKNKKRSNENKQLISLGENLQALLNLTSDIPSNNCWVQFDLPLTIYAINYFTGWINALLLSQEKDTKDCHYILFYNPIILSTFFYLKVELFREYKDLFDNDLEEISCTIEKQFNKIMQLYTLSYHDSDEFMNQYESWYKTASNKEKSELQSEAEEAYEELECNLYGYDGFISLNLNELCQFISQAIIQNEQQELEEEY